MASADGTGRAGDDGCGVDISVFIRFAGEDIVEARFTATGSSAAIAAGSLLTQMINGTHWRQAAALPAPELAGALRSGKAREDTGANEDTRNNAVSATRIENASRFAIDALHAALEDSLQRGRFPTASVMSENRVLVAMSGGVDSSTACLLSHQAGREVIGVTMRLWSDPECEAGNAPGCCSPSAIRDAREVCHSLGLPHLTVDYSDEFADIVVADFVSEYLAGRTPNPCTRCNGYFRFPELACLADSLGAAGIVTGHYALIRERAGGHLLARARDRAKDQSYMLWRISSGILPRLEFPLGCLTKPETRELARKAGLTVHARPESQEVCFIPDDDYRRFLRSRGSALPGEGDIVDAVGIRLGTHKGYIDYTVGQRRHLGISAPEPLYVLATDPLENIVMVGGRDELAIRRLIIGQVNSFIPAEDAAGRDLSVQVRYNSPPVRGRVIGIAPEHWTLELGEAVYGVAPGQSAVIYDEDTLIAGGVIESSGQAPRQ